MANKNNMLDLEMSDSEFDDGCGVDVGRRNDVGNIAMNKDITRLET